jgi:hypothetical protein
MCVTLIGWEVVDKRSVQTLHHKSVWHWETQEINVKKGSLMPHASR